VNKLLVRGLGLAAALVACEGRELTVFDVTAPAPLAGAGAGSSGAGAAGAPVGGSAGSGGTGGVISSGGTGGGVDGTPDGGDPSFASAGRRPCADDDDCGDSWVCEKRGCDAPLGQCVPWPPLCFDDPLPVCGCDGITYWNDCVRLKSLPHPQLSSFGPCRETARACDSGDDCGAPYASCSHLMGPGQLCSHGAGSCWVLPPQCVAGSDQKKWRECRPPDSGLPGTCRDTCTAIATGRPHAELRRGETCN
jgi:hypothetical protein